jgi:putative heme-binding domain-containing protein
LARRKPGEFVTGGYLQNTVERFRLHEEGSTFKAERLPPLIESTNTAFRIVDVRFGPDGALYLCDWYNRLIGHYQTSLRDPGRDHVRGRIWRVTAKGRAPVAWKKLQNLAVPQLLTFLSSSERWNRQLAKRVLADRPTPEVLNALREWQRSGDSMNNFEALGVYASHETIETSLLAKLAIHPDPGARAYAARLIGHWASRIRDPLSWLAPLVIDPHPRVRLEAVVACSYVQHAHAVEVAAAATDLPMDSHLEYAFTQTVHALKSRWMEPHQKGQLTFEGRAGRAAAFARADGSGDTVAEAASRLGRVTEVALEKDEIDRLAHIVATSGGPKELPVLLRPRTFMLGDTPLDALHAEILETLWRRVTDRPVLPAGNLTPQLAPLLESSSQAIRQAAIRLSGAWQVEPVRNSIVWLSRDESGDFRDRTAAIAALGGYAKQDDRDVLVALAETAKPAELRVDAIVALTSFAAQAAGNAAALWLANPPVTLDSVPFQETTQRLLGAFLSRKDGAAILVGALEPRPPSKPSAHAALAALSASGRRDPGLARILERAAGATSVPGPTVAEIPNLAQTVRRAGRALAGKGVFERPALACVNCHATDGTPGKIGPDLGALGTSQTVEFILGAILDPQKEVKEGFVAHEIETRDGEVHQGYLRGETATEIALFDHLENRVLLLHPNQVASRRQLGSLMPSGLADTLSREDLRDLVAYLARLGRRD